MFPSQAQFAGPQQLAGPHTTQPPPAPRPVSLMQLGFAPFFLLLFGGIWGLVGWSIAAVFTFTGGPIWDDWILDGHSTRTVASVVHVEATSSRINGARVYAVTWQARDAAGGLREGVVHTRGAPREPLEVEYDPDHPRRSRVVGGSASAFGGFIAIPLFFGIAGLVIFSVGLTLASRRRAIYRDGTAVQAQVTAFDATSMRVNRRRVFRATFRFNTPMGPVTASSTTTNHLAPGSVVWILYDPARPDRALLS